MTFATWPLWGVFLSGISSPRSAGQPPLSTQRAPRGPEGRPRTHPTPLRRLPPQPRGPSSTPARGTARKRRRAGFVRVSVPHSARRLRAPSRRRAWRRLTLGRAPRAIVGTHRALFRRPLCAWARARPGVPPAPLGPHPGGGLCVRG